METSLAKGSSKPDKPARSGGKDLSPAVTDKVIGMAWADRVSFEEIEEKMGLSEKEVILVMRRNLKPGSFRRWRKRVSGRSTKHRRLWRASREI